MYVCLCKGLTESDVRRVTLSEQAAGRLDEDRLAQALGIDDEECCGRCVKNICRLMTMAGDCRGCGNAARPSSPQAILASPQP